MKRIIIAILCLGSFGLCSCFRPASADILPQSTDMVHVSLAIVPAEQDIFTRSTDENIITDVNLYVADGQRVIKHIYSEQSELFFDCPAGEYTLFVLANLHADTGNMDYNSLRTYPIYAAGTYQDLPMAASKKLKIEASEMVALPSIEVERMVSKISYTVTVAANTEDIKLQSVQALKLPRVTMPFNDFGSYPNTFSDGELMTNDTDPSKMSGVFYMLPNLQGENPAIESQADKNPLNAPDKATYLRIRALRGNKVLDYSVYLGENSTSDFNVRPNTAHTYDITLLNDNETDVRIRSYTIDVRCRTEIEPENGINLAFSPITLSLSLSGQASDMNVACDLEFLKGQAEYLCFEGTPVQPRIHIPIVAGDTIEFCITYSPPDFKAENGVMGFRLHFYDRYGYVTSQDFSFCYAKRIEIYTKWFGNQYGKGYGVISSPDAYKTVEKVAPSAVSYLVYCPQEGCTLVAKPDPGRTFVGWYKEHNGLGLLGIDERLFYMPLSNSNTIYANIL